MSGGMFVESGRMLLSRSTINRNQINMRPRHEFQLGELTVSYLIAQWHENDGEFYEPFPEGIDAVKVSNGHSIGRALESVPELWAVIVEKCREDMLDRV